jgi:tetratricopeptide (TPR) repeat protein
MVILKQIWAWGIPLLLPRENLRNKFLFPSGIAILVILSVLTWQQSGCWKNSIELFNHTLHIVPNYTYGYYNRGFAYAELGQYQNAIADYNIAIRMKPHNSEAHCNRGTAYAKLGQYQLAIEDHNKAIRLKTDYTDAYNNMAITYFMQGSDVLGCRDAQGSCALGKCKLLDMLKLKGYCR